MIEEILISLQDKLRSQDYLDNETAVDKFGSLLQSQNAEKQRKIIATLLPTALASRFENIQKKTVQVAFNYPTILKDVLPALKLSTEPTVRFWAHFMMIELGFLAQMEMIEIVNSRESDEIRKLILEALAKKPDKQIILTFLEKISDPSWIIRKQAKKILIQQGDAIYQIIQEYFLSCPSRQKYECIKIIPLILKDKAIILFQKMLESDKNGIVKPYICAGLGEIRTEEALNILLGLLEDPSLLVREEAVKALTNWGREVVRPLISILATASQDLMVTIMGLMGRVLQLDVLKELTEIFGTPTQEMKFFILTALAEVRNSDVVHSLIDFLRDESVFIQEYSIKILVRLGVHAIDPLLAQIDSEDEKIIIPVLKVIGEIGSKDGLRPLLFLIDNNKSALTRTCAIEAISKLQKFELIAGLLLLKLDDKDLTIRHTIIENLSKHPRNAFIKDLVLSTMDRNADVALGAREILRRRDYPGVPAFLMLYEQASEFEKDKIISMASKLADDQLDSIFKNEKIQIDSFNPESVETRVLSRKYNKENITDIKELFYYLQEEGGSDLHLSIGLPPSIRIHGELVRTTFEMITPEKSRYLIFSLLNEAQKQAFAERMEIDFSFEILDCARFRANVFTQKNGVAGVFRIIPNAVPTFEALSLDREIMAKVCNHRSGLILVTGSTGSGKSTTLAAMIDHINRTRYDHIITIEDPIEFVHPHKRCVLTQRELGSHTHNFSNALRSALREDPDVILVGEMRDLETMHLAISAAETGHLVFSTLHTINAYESINRVLGSFPGDQQETVRMQLAGTLRAILSQRLIPAYLSSGRILAYEVLIATTPVRRCVKENKIDQIISIMQTSRSDGMITMDACLEDLVIKKRITFDDGLKYSEDKKTFEQRVQERLGLKPKSKTEQGQGQGGGAQHSSPPIQKPVKSETPQVKGPAKG
ncbi:MAG: PilT/PilU family type 4a pilus ATPase [Candidatus Riflebacteria bacterium]|nr:PilT/PilU family type 4a pilus ATPase [Candidatus Riflebacteria bacterium]